MKTYGELLEEARLAKGLTRREVAGKLGLSESYIRDVVRGDKSPLGPDSTERWAKIVGANKHDALAARDVTIGSASIGVGDEYSELENRTASRLSWWWDNLDAVAIMEISSILDQNGVPK